jgi:hypothetical protein
MDSMQRKNIANPAEGLLVYDLNSFGFWYYQNGQWVDLNKVNRVFENANGVVRNSGDDTSADFVFGSPQLESDGDISHNARMFFDKGIGAFRVGGDAASWDNINLGLYSFGSGFDTRANGLHSTAMGYYTEASDFASVAMGDQSRASGPNSTAIGFRTTASGLYSTAMGSQTIASGINATTMGSDSRASGSASTAMGRSTIANGFVGTVVGQYNDSIVARQTTSSSTTPLFIVGNGTSNAARSNAIVIRQDGRVGIGTNIPGETLDVQGNIKSSGGYIYAQDGTQSVVLNTNAAGGYVQLDVGGTGHASDHIILGEASTGNKNNVGIGTISPTALLEVNSDIVKKVNGGTWAASSDRRLKKNIKDYRDGLQEVLQIHPVRFQYNEVSGYHTNKEYIGVIAQELNEVAPYMVSTFPKDGDEYLQVDNSAMTYMLINAVKDQQKQIEEQKELLKEVQREQKQTRRLIDEILKGMSLTKSDILINDDAR